MKSFYPKALLVALLFLSLRQASAQTPTVTGPGVCPGIIANFNTNDNGYNSPSIYGSIFDSAMYFNSPRGYWTDYLPPLRVTAPGFPRVLNIISPPYPNPNPTGTFNVGFYYIVNNPAVDRFQVRIISVTQTPMGTVTNVEASTGLQFFTTWSTPTPYIDNGPNPTPLLNGFEGYVCVRLTDPDIVNGPNTTFRVEVSYIINQATFAVFDNVSIGPVLIPLPVDFIGLVATRDNNNSVNLKWDVSDEVNVQEYQVERSENGGYFTSVGSVNSKGKSLYTFTNTNVPVKTLFYRIKSIDIDGRFKYSGILRLKANSSNSFSDKLQAYPSPAKDEVTISHKKLTTGARITLISLDGKIIKTMIPAMGASTTMIKLNDVIPGLYILKLEDGYGAIQSVKLVKSE